MLAETREALQFGIIHLKAARAAIFIPPRQTLAAWPCWPPRGSHSNHVPVSLVIPGAAKRVPRSARPRNDKRLPKIGGRPAGFPPSALDKHQSACKPGSGWHADCYTHMRDGHSSWTPVARRLQQPTRTAGSGHRSRSCEQLRAVPIRSCSRWGLPCRRRCRRRGALLPHRFTLAAAKRNAPQRSVLCGTFPGLAPAGCYPAPSVHGARTFLPGFLEAGAAVRPTDRTGMGG